MALFGELVAANCHRALTFWQNTYIAVVSHCLCRSALKIQLMCPDEDSSKRGRGEERGKGREGSGGRERGGAGKEG